MNTLQAPQLMAFYCNEDEVWQSLAMAVTGSCKSEKCMVWETGSRSREVTAFVPRLRIAYLPIPFIRTRKYLLNT